jgi:dihydroorotate dehydrogenase
LIYRLLFRLVLQRIDAERAHTLAARALRLAATVPFVRAAMRRRLVSRDPALSVRALGLTLPSPLGVAAGVDKDASWFDGLGLLGFGYVEVGTVTARPQAGNPGRRVLRLPADRALLNRMGFPNAGAEAVGRRLEARFPDPDADAVSRRLENLLPNQGAGAVSGRQEMGTAPGNAGVEAREATLAVGDNSRAAGSVIVGVNVGKSRAVSLAEADADYRSAVRRLAPLCDYLVVNVSSPNTPGLRELQSVERLRSLLAAVRGELAEIGCERPLLVKIAPDITDGELDALAEEALSLSLDGIVAVNTTVDRTVLTPASRAAAERVEGGGVSGAPLRARALEVLERLYARVGTNLVLISVGGIGTPEDAWQRILAGATLVQVYTGFVYGGPAWPARVNRELARRVRAAGKSSIQELVGAGAGVSV